MSFLILSGFAGECTLCSAGTSRIFRGPLRALPLAAMMRKLRPLHGQPAYRPPPIYHLLVCRVNKRCFRVTARYGSRDIASEQVESVAQLLAMLAKLRMAIALVRAVHK